jgi:Putative DNA-binding domain
MAFISGSKNRMLGTKTPDVYLPTIIASKGMHALKEHAIPANPSVWTIEAYPEFLTARRAELASIVNQFLRDVSEGESIGVDPLVLLTSGESDILEFKQTARVNLHTGQQDKAIERGVVKTVAAFLNSRGGTLLIGVDDEGIPSGLDDDLKTLGKRPTLDGFQQFLLQTLTNVIGTTTAASLNISFPVVDDRAICMIEVPAAAKPVYVDDGKVFYLRSGNTTRELSMQEAHTYIATRFR